MIMQVDLVFLQLWTHDDDLELHLLRLLRLFQVLLPGMAAIPGPIGLFVDSNGLLLDMWTFF